MVEFLRKYESRGDKITRVNLIRITKSTFILYGVEVRYDKIFKIAACVRSPFIEKSMIQSNFGLPHTRHQHLSTN